MPEAAVDHDCNTIFREYYVGTAGEFPVLETEAEAMGMQSPPNQDLRLGVLSAYAGHAMAALLRG
jgi:hypothetical protein